MEIVNFIRRDNDYLPAEPKEGTFYWLADNSIWFAPYSEIDESEENGGLIRIDNNLTIEMIKEITETLINGKGYLTEHQDISHLVSKDELEELIGCDSDFGEYATKSWVEEKGYLTEHQDISHLVSKDELEELLGRICDSDSDFGGNLNELRNELIEIIEGYFNDLFISKQDKLISGENIKTINNTSILGKGNIELPTKEYVNEKISEHKYKWRVIV